jgi:hypothetical protein
VTEADEFASFEAFPLKRRFLDPATGALASHFAGRMKPFTAARARALATEATARCAEAGDFTVTFRTDDSPGLVTRRLRALPVPDESSVVIWWDRATAVMTEWGVFVGYWDDFCYPASDDISIWPTDGGWTLCYRRYEVLQFGAHRLPT